MSSVSRVLCSACTKSTSKDKDDEFDPESGTRSINITGMKPGLSLETLHSNELELKMRPVVDQVREQFSKTALELNPLVQKDEPMKSMKSSKVIGSRIITKTPVRPDVIIVNDIDNLTSTLV